MIIGTGAMCTRRDLVVPSSLVAAVDADWGGDKHTRRSTTGYVVTVNGSPIFWKSKRQTVIALSSADSEYVALSSCAKDVSWLRKLYWEVCHQTPWLEQLRFAPTQVLVDSTAAQSIAASWQASSWTKHISLKHHHVRELIVNGTIVLCHVASKDQPADLLTKVTVFDVLCRIMALLNIGA